LKINSIISLIFVIGCVCQLPVFAQDQGSSRSAENYNIWVPGFSGGFYYFSNTSEHYFAGGSFRFDIVYALEKNKQKATFAERGRNELYLDIGLFSSIPENGTTSTLLFRYLLGIVTSFETPKTLNREWLVPYIGIELGGIYIGGEGNGFMAVPILGLNILTLPSMTLSIDTGLLLNTVAFEKYLGLRTELHLNFVF
jgi:hypothetical protein